MPRGTDFEMPPRQWQTISVDRDQGRHGTAIKRAYARWQIAFVAASLRPAAGPLLQATDLGRRDHPTPPGGPRRSLATLRVLARLGTSPRPGYRHLVIMRRDYITQLRRYGQSVPSRGFTR